MEPRINQALMYPVTPPSRPPTTQGVPRGRRWAERRPKHYPWGHRPKQYPWGRHPGKGWYGDLGDVREVWGISWGPGGSHVGVWDLGGVETCVR